MSRMGGIALEFLDLSLQSVGRSRKMRLTDAQVEQVIYYTGYTAGMSAVVKAALDVKVDTLQTDRAVVWLDLELWKKIEETAKRCS